MVALTLTLTLGSTGALDVFDDVTYMGFGTGTTEPSISDTTLETETLRVLLDSFTKDTVNNIYTFIGRIPITQLNSSTTTELGLFNAVTSGTMRCRILSPVAVTKTNDEEVLFTLVIKTLAVNT